MGRSCGSCSVCCWVAAVEGPDWSKPTRTPCQFEQSSPNGSCGIYNRPDRPPVCGTFECAWKRGLGTEEERPDKIGLMLSVNDLNGGTFVFALECKPDAVATAGRSIVAEATRRFQLPVVVVDHDSVYPHDTGDRVVLVDRLRHRARSMLGKKLEPLSDDVEVYELK